MQQYTVNQYDLFLCFGTHQQHANSYSAVVYSIPHKSLIYIWYSVFFHSILWCPRRRELFSGKLCAFERGQFWWQRYRRWAQQILNFILTFPSAGGSVCINARILLHLTQTTHLQHLHWKKNRSIWLNDWVLPLSPESIIFICQVDSCIRREDSLNVTLSQVHSSLKNF